MAGAKAAVPALRNQKISISQWHRDALAAHTVSSAAAPIKLGRSWDHLALDIFYANQNSPVWFWADVNSTAFLEYWVEFDQNTTFVLIYTSPQDALIKALHNGKETLLALEEVIQEWCDRTQTLLRFHLRHPDRSALIDGALALTQSSSYVNILTDQWQLPLQNAELPSSENIPNQHLDSYLIRHLLQHHPKVADLHNEVQARLVILTGYTPSPSSVFDQIIADHMTQKRNIQALQSTNELLQQRLKKNEKKIKSTEQDKQVIANELAKLEFDTAQDKAKTNAQIASLERDHRLKEGKITRSLNSALAENEILLQALHTTQESVQASFNIRNSEQNEVAELQRRLQNLLSKFPRHWEFDEIEIKPIKSKNKANILQWRIKNLYLEDLKLNELRFQTNLTGREVAILFLRPLSGAAPWPKALLHGESLTLSPSLGAAYQGDNDSISRLGTSDWKYINILISKLITLLGDPTFAHFPAGVSKGTLKSGLSALANQLKNWPLVLRYDDVRLSESTRGSEYQCIGIKFKNLSLGSICTQELDYRIATVDHSAGSFGQNPRIEFPESSKHSLQNWFVESDDERGPRLELRFLKPNAMDTQVWNSLAETDRVLVAGLVSTLPIQLEDLKKLNSETEINWEDWHDLGLAVKTILSSQLSTQKS